MYIQSESENVLTTFFSSIQNNIGLNLNFLDFCQFNWIRKSLALWNHCILQCWVWGPKRGNKGATMWRQGRILCGNLMGKAWNVLSPKINQLTHNSHTIHTILNSRGFIIILIASPSIVGIIHLHNTQMPGSISPIVYIPTMCLFRRLLPSPPYHGRR